MAVTVSDPSRRKGHPPEVDGGAGRWHIPQHAVGVKRTGCEPDARKPCTVRASSADVVPPI